MRSNEKPEKMEWKVILTVAVAVSIGHVPLIAGTLATKPGRVHAKLASLRAHARSRTVIEARGHM